MNVNKTNQNKMFNNNSGIKLFDSRFAANTLNNSYRCPKCRNEYAFNYDTADKYGADHHVKSNRPIVLPCGHNMCENCVYHNRQNLTCIICLTPIIIPKDPTKQFTNFNVRDHFDMNFFLMGQLHHWRFFRREGSANNTLFMSAAGLSNLNSTLLDTEGSRTRAPSVIKCVECEAVPSLGRCRTCKDFYCKRCFDNVHKNSKVLKKHILQYFEKVSNQQSEILRLTKSRFCRRHQRTCDRYCKKCDMILCGECARNDHQHHHYRKLIEENDILMEELSLTLDNAQLARDNLNKGQKDIKAVEAEIEDYATKTLEEISNYFVQLHSFLQNEERLIVAKFCEISQHPQFLLRQANIKLNESLETLSALRSTLEQYQHSSPPAHFYLGRILPKYNEIIQQMPTNIQISKPQTNPFIFVVKNDVRADIRNAIDYSYKDPKLLIKMDASFYDPSSSSIDTTINSMPSNLTMTHNKHLSPKPNRIKQNKKLNQNYNKTCNPIQDVSMTNVAPMPSKNDSVNMVRITNIKSPDHFYIQNVKDIQSIRQLSHTYLCNDMANNIPKEITEGYYYMAYHNTDRQWYRGMLKKILPNDIFQIFLLDFGINMEVSQNSLCDIEEQHLKIPFAAIRCAIYDIVPTGKKWTEVENSLLLELLQNKPVRISIIEKVGSDMLKIDLHTELTKSVRGTFLYTGLARERPGVHSFKLQVKTNLPVIKIEDRIPKTNVNAGDIFTVTVLHVEGPEEFYVIKRELFNKKEEVKIELNQYYHNSSSKLQQIYLATVQMCCAVNVGDVWYRAVVEEIKDKGQLYVRLVDEGRRELINWRQAFVLVEAFRNKREFAIPCTLADIEPLQENNYVYTSAAVKDFKQMITNPELRMEIIAVASKMCKVALNICKKALDINIGATLVNKGYGVSTGESTLITEIVKTPKNNRFNKQVTNVPNEDSPKQAATNVKGIKRTLIKITHIISPGEFYIYLSNLRQGFETFHKHVQNIQANKLGTKEPLPCETREWYEDNHCLVHIKDNSTSFAQLIDMPQLQHLEWYRGIITEINYLPGEEQTFSVFLRDVGVTVRSVYSRNLYSIDSQLDRVTNGVHCCCLACIEPAGGTNWSRSAIDSFTHYVMNAETLLASLQAKVNHNRNSLAIILWSSKIETANPLAPCITKYSNINRNLVRKGLAHMVEPLDTKQQFDQLEELEADNGEISIEQWLKSFSDNVLLKDIENNEELPLQMGDNAENIEDNHPLCKYLNEMDFEETTGKKAPAAWFSNKVITKTIFTGYPTYIDFDCIVYLHEADDKKFLEKVTNTLTDAYGAMEPPPAESSYAIDQACVVRYHVDGKYYRGIITEGINDDREWGVHFIDYGNVESVGAKDLRPYAPFPNLPAIASKYIIDCIKPKDGAAKFSLKELDQIHVLLVAKLVSIRIQSSELRKDIKRCSIRLGALDVASELIERGIAEGNYQPLFESKSLDLFYLEEQQNALAKKKIRKNLNPLPSAPIDDYVVFNPESDMSIDYNEKESDGGVNNANNDMSDNSMDDDDDDDSSTEFDHLNKMLERLTKKKNMEKIAKPKAKAANETSATDNAINKPPPKKRMFNHKDYTKMMNVMMMYEAEDAVDNIGHDFNENDEEDDDDVIELGESFAMNYWHSTTEDMRLEEDDDINHQLENRVFSFDDDVESDFDAFHPNITSTAFSHFSGIENFKIPQLPSAMHHFKCRVVYVITPVILQIFPLHTEFHYRDIELQRSIKEMVKRSLPPLTTFEPRTPCLACYSKDKSWYRAVIRSYNPTAKTLDVLYVDYLNSEMLPLKYVRQCPRELLGWPLRTFCVRLHGIEVNPNITRQEVKLALQQFISKRELFAVIKKHPICNSMVLENALNKADYIEISLYESKEASLKGVTIYEPLIEKNYFKRF